MFPCPDCNSKAVVVHSRYSHVTLGVERRRVCTKNNTHIFVTLEKLCKRIIPEGTEKTV